MLNVLLVEDHNVVRNGLKLLLETDADIAIVAEAANGYQALKILAENKDIDLVLSDINMPEMDGIALAKSIKDLGSDVKIVLLSMHDTISYVSEAFRSGASAYVLKTSTTKELMFALKQVQSGEVYLCSTLTSKLVALNLEKETQKRNHTLPKLDLSPREAEVLQLMAKGLTNQEMSDKLFLSRRTVEGHRQGLIDKFSVRNSAELITLAMRGGLIH